MTTQLGYTKSNQSGDTRFNNLVIHLAHSHMMVGKLGTNRASRKFRSNTEVRVWRRLRWAICTARELLTHVKNYRILNVKT